MKLKKLILCLWVLIMVTMILPIGVFAEMLPIAPEAMVKKEPEVSVQTEKKEETKNSVNLKEDQISESIQPETVQEPYIELPSFDIPAEVSESTKNEMPTLMQGQQIQKIEPQAETKTLIESDYEYKDIDGGVEITKYTGNAIQVKIPSLINSEKVVSIGMEAFINNNTIESVTLGSNTKIIGKSAFRGCNNLTTAKLNEGLEKIGDSAFIDSGLTEIVIPNSVVELGITGGSFQGCENLKSVTIGSGLKRIEAYTFIYCGLENIFFANTENLKEIGEYSFYGCGKLKEAVLPEGLLEIKKSAFSFCTKLKKVTIPASVTDISDKSEYEHAFSGDLLLFIFGKTGSAAEKFAVNEKIPFVSDTTLIENGYYYEAVNDGVKIILSENMKEKTIPKMLGGKKVIEIGRRAFSGNTNFTEINTDSLKIIGDNAFQNCDNVTNINIKDVDSVGIEAFNNCKLLQNVNVSTKSLGASAFNYCRNLTSVTLGRGLETLDKSTFLKTGKVKRISLPETLKKVGGYALTGSNVETLIISPEAKDVSLEDYSLSGSNLVNTSLYFPAGVINIGEKAFGSKVPEGVTIYGEIGTVAEKYAIDHGIKFSTDVWRLGDVNKDNTINASDSLLDLRHAVKEITLVDGDFTRGDVNKDNVINASDGLLILRCAVKEINEFD